MKNQDFCIKMGIAVLSFLAIELSRNPVCNTALRLNHELHIISSGEFMNRAGLCWFISSPVDQKLYGRPPPCSMESSVLEKSSYITKFSHQPSTILTTKSCPQVVYSHIF